MPMMMYNGVPYGVSTDSLKIIPKTKAEYEALTEEEKMREDVIYEITDQTGGVKFGSTDISGVGDGTVTGAIGALNSKIKFKEISVTFSGGKASVSEESITANSVIMAIRKPSDGSLSSVVLSACARNGGAYLCAYTTADTSLTGTVDVYLMWTV
jgi:hypothetical protein